MRHSKTEKFQPAGGWKFLVIVFVLVVAAGINTRIRSFSTGVVVEVFRQVFKVFRHSLSGCTDEEGFFCKFPLSGAFSVLSLLCREIQGGASLIYINIPLLFSMQKKFYAKKKI
ncbi:hypothetical protein VPH35_136715 [Triticum aestivum]